MTSGRYLVPVASDRRHAVRIRAQSARCGRTLGDAKAPHFFPLPQEGGPRGMLLRVHRYPPALRATPFVPKGVKRQSSSVNNEALPPAAVVLTVNVRSVAKRSR